MALSPASRAIPEAARRHLPNVRDLHARPPRMQCPNRLVALKGLSQPVVAYNKRQGLHENSTIRARGVIISKQVRGQAFRKQASLCARHRYCHLNCASLRAKVPATESDHRLRIRAGPIRSARRARGSLPRSESRSTSRVPRGDAHRAALIARRCRHQALPRVGGLWTDPRLAW